MISLVVLKWWLLDAWTIMVNLIIIGDISAAPESLGRLLCGNIVAGWNILCPSILIGVGMLVWRPSMVSLIVLERWLLDAWAIVIDLIVVSDVSATPQKLLLNKRLRSLSSMAFVVLVMSFMVSVLVPGLGNSLGRVVTYVWWNVTGIVVLVNGWSMNILLDSTKCGMSHIWEGIGYVL